MPFGTDYGKARMAWLTDGEKISKIFLFVLTEFTNVTGTHTDTQTPHDEISRACIASRGNNSVSAVRLMFTVVMTLFLV